MVIEFVILLRSPDQRNIDKHGFGQKDLNRELKSSYQIQKIWPQRSMSEVKIFKNIFQ